MHKHKLGILHLIYENEYYEILIPCGLVRTAHGATSWLPFKKKRKNPPSVKVMKHRPIGNPVHSSPKMSHKKSRGCRKSNSSVARCLFLLHPIQTNKVERSLWMDLPWTLPFQKHHKNIKRKQKHIFLCGFWFFGGCSFWENPDSWHLLKQNFREIWTPIKLHQASRASHDAFHVQRPGSQYRGSGGCASRHGVAKSGGRGTWKYNIFKKINNKAAARLMYI